MSTITVSIPEEDLAFLQTLAATSGTTPEAFIAKQARLLRERMQKPLHPDVVAISGIIKGDGGDRSEYHESRARKS